MNYYRPKFTYFVKNYVPIRTHCYVRKHARSILSQFDNTSQDVFFRVTVEILRVLKFSIAYELITLCQYASRRLTPPPLPLIHTYLNHIAHHFAHSSNEQRLRPKKIVQHRYYCNTHIAQVSTLRSMVRGRRPYSSRKVVSAATYYR